MTRWPPRPRLSTSFYKAHGLGNDYLVFREGSGWVATPEHVARVCDPHRGVGSDGIVVLLDDREGGVYRLRMFNPDGGEFERSGNGLRVLASALIRSGEPSPYEVEVGGSRVLLTVYGSEGATHDVSVDMGVARTGPGAIEMDASALDDEGHVEGPAGELLWIVPVSIGNPHVVVLGVEPTSERLAAIGPFLVGHPAIARGANVQLAERVGPGRCRAVIWERGVGPTSASGTSACAVAAAMVVAGRLRPGEVSVEMPGGDLGVVVGPGLEVTLRGPVEEVFEGALTIQFAAQLDPNE